MDERPIDLIRMRLLGYGITTGFGHVLGEWGWRIAYETPALSAYLIHVVAEIRMFQEHRIVGQALWDPRPAPVSFDTLRDEALMDALLRVVEYGVSLTDDVRRAG